MHWKNGLKFGMLINPVHLHNWSDFSQSLLIFLILVPLLSETGQIWGFRHFIQNTWKEWPGIWPVDVPWPLTELIRFPWRYVDFPHFDATLTHWNWINLRFPGIFLRMQGRNDLEFGKLMYPILTTFRTDSFLSWSVEFPHFDATLT